MVQVCEVPKHLAPYIAEQDASLYTPMDHAGWRYILRVSRAFFAGAAHQKYLDGLVAAGIGTERIPLISEMDDSLRRFGWRAVPVVGFIPPAVFMEFLSIGFLPIACDMRVMEHLDYTPAPDIVHEAAGHAPILADPAFSAYLHRYGEIARKVIFSNQDMNVYHAIRYLSDTKEDPTATAAQIAEAQSRLDIAVAAVDAAGEPSEATLLSRMGWWTFEYGLIGPIHAPKIYGAGLLSSVGESYDCFGAGVRKVPFSIDCIDVSYDITKPQPQLFVTPDFETLTRVLEEFAGRLAFREGGVESLEKARRAATVTTTQLDSGIQVSGVVGEVVRDAGGRAAFVRWTGPCQLSVKDRELAEQGVARHPVGFSAPLGRVQTLGGRALHEVPAPELGAVGIKVGRPIDLAYESGIRVLGSIKSVKCDAEGRVRVLILEPCEVMKGERILFSRSWGQYDLISGVEIASVFGGAADRVAYLEATGGFHQPPVRQKTNRVGQSAVLNDLYARVRRLREREGEGNGHRADVAELVGEVRAALDADFPDDWLLRLELLECWPQEDQGARVALRSELRAIGVRRPRWSTLIERGLDLAGREHA